MFSSIEKNVLYGGQSDIGSVVDGDCQIFRDLVRYVDGIGCIRRSVSFMYFRQELSCLAQKVAILINLIM